MPTAAGGRRNAPQPSDGPLEWSFWARAELSPSADIRPTDLPVALLSRPTFSNPSPAGAHCVGGRMSTSRYLGTALAVLAVAACNPFSRQPVQVSAADPTLNTRWHANLASPSTLAG